MFNIMIQPIMPALAQGRLLSAWHPGVRRRFVCARPDLSHHSDRRSRRPTRHQGAGSYRWLEDDTSAETAKWVEAQNKVTFAISRRFPIARS